LKGRGRKLQAAASRRKPLVGLVMPATATPVPTPTATNSGLR
jgi:hypothetical protein